MVGDHRARIYALGYLAMIAAEDGRVDEARDQIRQVTGGDSADHFADGDQFVQLMVSLATAIVLDMTGDAAMALSAADVAVASARQGGGVLEVAKALAVRAGILRHLGDFAGARASRHEAAALLRLPTVTGIDPNQIAANGGHRDNSAALPVAGEELTEKESELLRLLDTNLSRREISERLFVTLNTVKSHQRSLYRKLAVRSRAEAVRRAEQLGLL
jgi:DNA-binding CsgD family transcriptional regulator